MMRLVLNGAPRDVPDGCTVAELLRSLGRDPEAQGVAVARNGELLPRQGWARATLADGDRLDVVTAAQGG